MATLSMSPDGNEPPHTPGRELKKLREASGLTLRGLAQKAGISASALSRWESGKRLPSIPELDAVFAALSASDAQKRTVLHLINAPRAIERLRGLNEYPLVGSGTANVLWAMRQRKGWTQTQIAQAVGVRQNQIARWENGDNVPETSLLHTLCYALQASPEEIAALTCLSNGGSPLSPEWTESRDLDQWFFYLSRMIFQPPTQALVDLPYVSLEQHLTKLGSRHDFARALLPHVFAVHARHISALGHHKQGAHWAERGLAVMRARLHTHGINAIHSSLWFSNVLALAVPASFCKRPSDARASAALLRDWLPVLRSSSIHQSEAGQELSRSYYAWGQMRLASYLSKLGHTHEAVALGEAACREIESVNNTEGAHRRRDFARVLLDAKQPANALQALTQSEKLVGLQWMSWEVVAEHHLIQAAGYGALGDTKTAQECARAAEQIIDAHGLHKLRNDLNQITAAL